MPLVSIVMPVYNAGPYLRQCLDSVTGQTYRDLEILCIDDGSTDESPEILREYAEKDPRVKVFPNDTGEKGAAPARNAGMDRAKGKYLMILDSDDFFEPDMVETCVSQAETCDADLVIFRIDRFDSRTGTLSPYLTHQLDHLPAKEVFSVQDCPDHILEIGLLGAWNKLYRRDLVEENHLRFLSLPVSNDQYVPALALALAERIRVVDRVLMHYRAFTGGSVSDKASKYPEAPAISACKIVEKLRELGLYDQVKLGYLGEFLSNLRDKFDVVDNYAALKRLHGFLLEEVFPRLGAEDLPEGALRPTVAAWYHMMRELPLEEILFLCARSYGSFQTTKILRFQVPYDTLPKGGKIVLLGRGDAGRQWYSQILLSRYCDVALWANDASEIPADLAYDAVVTAK